MEREVYSREFFAGCADGSTRSASFIVPMVLSLVPLRSVIDVGCGTGSWAAAFQAQGVPDVWAMDGDYVDRSQLQISNERFLAWNLLDPIRVDRVFDLAVCLEVAEHLPESRASDLISDLTSLAPCVLFSAAVPGQGGTRHINEQYLPYWIELFRSHGYEGIDPIRPRIFGNDSVEWWYQQNIVMFVSAGHELTTRGFSTPHTIIHQCLYERARNPTFGLLAKTLPQAALKSLRWHIWRR